jgi:hypothetical protein
MVIASFTLPSGEIGFVSIGSVLIAVSCAEDTSARSLRERVAGIASVFIDERIIDPARAASRCAVLGGPALSR